MDDVQARSELADAERLLATLEEDTSPTAAALRVQLQQRIDQLHAEVDQPKRPEAGGAEDGAGTSASAEPAVSGETSGAASSTSPGATAAPAAAGSEGSRPAGRFGRNRMLMAAAAVVAVALIVFLVTRPAKVDLPELAGEEVGYATGILRGLELEVETTEREDADVPPGQVLRQTPGEGETVTVGDTVTLTVAVSPEYTLEGTFTLTDNVAGAADNCFGTGGYDDIQPGMSVKVSDGSGAVLATGRTSNGSKSSFMCEFNFEVSGIPQADFYSIEVGRRGELSYSYDEMVANGWQVAFTLG